jgi:D-alanine transaminase
MVCGGKPVMLDRHIKRFYTSASMLRIEIPLAPDDLDSLLRDLSSRVDDPDQIVYFQVTRATAPRRHAFPQGATPNLWVTVTPKKLAKPESLRVITIDDTRHLHCNIKTLNLIPNCMAEQFAVDAGCDTAVFHRGEFVTEAVHANAHIIKDGKIVTHPADNLILPGIARERMTEIAKILGIPVEFRPFTLDEFKSADEWKCIGKPAPGVVCYVVNEEGKRVAPEESGELWVGGMQVTNGYWNRPDLNATMFFENPYEKVHDGIDVSTLYHSGDLVTLN